MKTDVLDKRRSEGWQITLWCTPRSVICQITTPDEFNGESPVVDIACRDFSTALKLAREVCQREQKTVEEASALVFNWSKTTPEVFISLMNSCGVRS